MAGKRKRAVCDRPRRKRCGNAGFTAEAIRKMAAHKIRQGKPAGGDNSYTTEHLREPDEGLFQLQCLPDLPQPGRKRPVLSCGVFTLGQHFANKD